MSYFVPAFILLLCAFYLPYLSSCSSRAVLCCGQQKGLENHRHWTNWPTMIAFHLICYSSPISNQKNERKPICDIYSWKKKLDKSNKSIDAVVTSAGFLWLHGSAVVRNSKSARRAGIWNESFISWLFSIRDFFMIASVGKGRNI